MGFFRSRGFKFLLGLVAAVAVAGGVAAFLFYRSLVADLYVWHPDTAGTADQTCAEIKAMLDEDVRAPSIRRIVASPMG